MSDAYAYDKNLVAGLKPLLHRGDGENFENWQKTASAKLAELLGLDNFRRCEPNFTITDRRETPEYLKISFTFDSEEGYTVPCCALIPPRARPVPVICLQGHTTGMHISLGYAKYPGDEKMLGSDECFAVRAVKEGFAAITLEQRYMGECGGDESGAGCLRGAALTALLAGRCAAGERVWDIMRLTDVLGSEFNEYFSLDGLTCLGNSGGGTAAFYASCLEGRIETAIVSCALCTYRQSIASVSHCCCNYIPGAARYFDMGDLAGLIAPRRLLVVSGRHDNYFPLAGAAESFAEAERAYRAAGCADNCRMIIGEGGHRTYADAMWKAYRQLVRE